MEYIFDKSQRESLYPFLISGKNEADLFKSQETLNDMLDEYLKLKVPLTDGFTEDIILREISKNKESTIVTNPKSKLSFVTDSNYTVQTQEGISKIHAPNEVIHVETVYINEPYQLDFKIKELDFVTLINIYKNLHNINIIKTFNECLRSGKLSITKELEKLPSSLRTEFYIKLSELETDKLKKLRDEINTIFKTNYEIYEIIFLFDQYLISNYIVSDDYNSVSKFIAKLDDNRKINETLRLESFKKYDDFINYNKYIRILKTLDNWLKLKRKIKDSKINTLSRLRKLLTKSEIALIESSYNITTKPNQCQHYNAVSKVYQNNYLIHEVDEFINRNVNDPNKQLICKLCEAPIMCTHAYKIMSNDYKDINEIYNEYKMEEPLGTKFYCKHCGEYLYTADYLEYKGFVKYSSINIDEEETYMKNTTWGILKNLFNDLHFSPKINVELLFNKMNSLIFDEVKKFDTFYRISDPEIRRVTLVLYIYIMGGMYAILLMSLQKEDNISFNHKYEHVKDVNKLTSIFYTQYIANKWKASLPKIGNVKDFISQISKRVARFNSDQNFFNIKNNKLVYDEILCNFDYIVLKKYYRLVEKLDEYDPLDEMFKILGTTKLDETDPIRKIKIPNMDKYLLKSDTIKSDKYTREQKLADYNAKYLYKYYKNDSQYDDDIKYYATYFKVRHVYEYVRTKDKTTLRYDLCTPKPIYWIKGLLGFYKWELFINDEGKIDYKTEFDKGKYIKFSEIESNPDKDKVKEYLEGSKPRRTITVKIHKDLIIPMNQAEYKDKINIEALKRQLHEDVNFNLFKNIGRHEGKLYKDVVNDNITYEPPKGVDDPRINKLHSYIVTLYIYLNQFKNNDPKFVMINKTSSVPSSSSGNDFIKSSSDRKKTKLITNISEYLNQYDKVIKEWNPEQILDWLLEYLINKLDSLYNSDYPKIREFYTWFVNYLLNTERTFTKVDIEKRNNKEFNGDDDFDFDEDNEVDDPFDEIDYEFDEDAEFETSD
jgi:hypothetical protein